ncbi:MAG TPA: MMPL family transporter [Myxococcota bacterium]|nr:MMPL family transporter [Myxococcota bacterium]
MDSLLQFVSRRARWVLLGIALLTAVALAGIVEIRTGSLRLPIDPSTDRLLPSTGDDRLFYDKVRRLFGSEEVLVVAFSAEDIFTSDHLRRIQRLTDRIGRVTGVARVLSLSNATSIRGADGDIEVGPFFSTIPEETHELERVRADVLSNPIYRNTLVSRDGSTALLLIYLDHDAEGVIATSKIDRQIATVANEERGDAAIWVTGNPHVKAVLSEMLLHSLGRTIPLAFAVVGLVSLISLRSILGLILPLSTIVIALVWTLGLIGWVHGSLNLVTTSVPPLVITLGFAYVMHLLAEYYRFAHQVPGDENAGGIGLVQGMLREVSLPIAVNGLTTSLGFLALALSPVLAIREFGLYSVIGILFSVILCLTFVPATLALLRRPKRTRKVLRVPPLDRLAERLAEFDVRQRELILVATALVLAICAVGMTRIRVGTEYISDFDSTSPVRRDFEAINMKFGGASPFFVVIQADTPDAVVDPTNLRAIEEFQRWLETQREIGSTTSIVDFLELVNRGMHDNDPAYLAVPESQRLAKQLLLAAGGKETSSLVDGRYETANVLVRTNVSDSFGMASLVERIQKRSARLPGSLSARVTGNVVVLDRALNDIARAQLQSLGSAIVTIYFAFALMLTSFRMGLIALIPNLVPIAVFYGILGFSGITLNLSTSVIACIALGIAVDVTIHYFARFNREARRLASERAATASSLRAVIRPITFARLGICLGFLILVTGDLRSQREVGVLAATTLAVAWLFDLTIGPALCSRVKLVTLWDVLTLNLGAEPERTIPLFEGLSARQARIFVLMSTLDEFSAGTRLFSEGDKGRDMYAVIDGRLVASVNRGDSRVRFGELSRGDLVGEVALFAGSRTADVDVMADARLLRFSEADLERIARRYPRIGVKILRNLNRVLAARVANTTAAIG